MSTAASSSSRPLPGDGAYLTDGAAPQPSAAGQTSSSRGRGRSNRGKPRPPQHANGDERSKPRRPAQPRKVEPVSKPSALNPTAATFAPGQPSISQPVSRSESPASRPQSEGEAKRQHQRPRHPRTKPSQTPVSSRRAAFDKQTKLTTESDVDTASDPPNLRKSRRAKQDEKDDWISKLTRGLKSKPFIECPICFNAITPSQPIWACAPPDRPPEPSDDNPNHYTACYTPFHLNCIRDWANRSLTEEKERLIAFGKEDEEVSWRCPGCQKRRTERVGGYRCFCGRLSSPPTISSAPHSCGELCSRPRPGCSHACPLPCHPGPCPPCQVALIVPCPSHNTPLTVKCALATSNNAALSPFCDETCGRDRNCGNRDHACEQLCHHGPCSPCAERETVTCYCGKDTKEVACGWQRKDDKQCAAVEDGVEKHWAGRFSCKRPCDGFYDCNIHACPEPCHPHPLHPLVCPMSPAVVTTCPCGSTPLSQLDAPPRPDCMAPVPTCKNQCPRSRPCGHPCPKQCHAGDCPPCHEQVVRPCRCGESMLVVPCDELRDKVALGEDITCERVCKALRNCGRHQCARVCCPLSWQAKKKKRPVDEAFLVEEDDLHECPLVCGKLLSCGLHTCTKKDHKGSCGRCLEASYDELICHCGRTVIYPPVACGTTISCPYPCARDPPACGHPRTAHPCHEQPICPPCPFLTTKPCACGKDPAVKNIRCSQEKVSCGQPCGELLECGYHRCDKKCHRPGECDPCTQVCNKPKKICRHPCTAACHAPAKCPETDSCLAIVTQSCSCGHLRTRTSCGASTSNPSSREAVSLKCNSECAVRQRNARLADALGIQPKEKPAEEWAPELKSFAIANHSFVKMVETTFSDFFKSSRQTMILPHMPLSKRTFVMSLADVYRLGRELIDQEPVRSVQIRRRVDTRIPSPLLSAAATPPPPRPNLGGLANLKTGPKVSPWNPKPPTVPTSVSGPSIASTTAAPSSAPRVPMTGQHVTGQVGHVDDDDWANDM
ncbi:hypothetical protein BD324DRAFT_602357 [Kockovaella imperatae]|uniref:NF-X1-type domain-containing protein n=1 Tax=Kockovaella imperatae TaxID=4999 RepID=A0A1Y1UCT9_9TREE|nr:hypothetical protein BD324DRAFT_602357 [Kockovaella imperatae]ORX35861.1 hypothetical protein BD324DRAFT_602357 [Kockovaella imperatae]